MKYSHILQPVKVGGLVLKNRLIASNALPHFLMGSEDFPSDQVIRHLAGLARNGASVVTFADWTNPKQRESFNEDGKRFPMFNLDHDPSIENYMCQLTDHIHYYQSYASIAIMPFAAPDPMYDVNEEPQADLSGIFMAKFGDKVYDNYGMGTMMRGGAPAKQLSIEQIHDIIELYAQRIRKYQLLGFDMCTLHFAYRATLFARFLSPKMNRRTDAYGGNIENRARFLLELCSRIKELCGRDFPIEVQLTGSEEGGTTIEETIRLAKLCEGLVDIFQFRAETANLNHPTPYNSRQHDYVVMRDCAAVKASGTSVLCEAIGGFQDVDDMEAILKNGKADLIGGARLFLADFHMYEKLKNERAQDITPCIRCNKCHVPSVVDEWRSFCSVNPEMGIAHHLELLTCQPKDKKKVAIVGGGPAGMRAAILADDRGYDVTLYEASDALGGQLKLMDAPRFKWNLVVYRDWMIQQIKDRNIQVCLNQEVTPEVLKQDAYDAVVLALGATPKTPDIPGADKAYNIFTVFGNEAQMGKKCVVVGGSESGTEAALYLAENGHDVTILTRSDTLAKDATPIHYRETIDEYYQTMKQISYVTGATTLEIGDGYVVYRDQDGNDVKLACDDVVLLGGMRPLQEEAMALYGIAADTFMIGDCKKVGNLHFCNRGAYSVINNL